MEHNRKQKILMIIALVIGIASLSIGFAAFSTTLNISSSASVTPNSDTFSVKFSTSQNSLVAGSVVTSENQYNLNVTNGVINNSSSPTISGLSVTFTEPGQSVTFDVYVRNEGEYTAYLNNVTSLGEKTCQGETGTNEELVQSACYDINRVISVAGLGRVDGAITNYPLEPGDSTLLSIIFEYSSMGTRVDGNFSVTFPDIALVYSTIDDPTIQPSVSKVVKLESGDLNTPGSIVSIGEEQFYVIGQEDGNVKLLSMYNLYVGNIIDMTWQITQITSSDVVQSSIAIGYGNKFPYVGTTEFNHFGTTYAGTVINGYVNSYAGHITDLGANIVYARLITKEELESLGCSSKELTCASAPEWIYATSYWTETNYDDDKVWRVNSLSGFDVTECNYAYGFGVRPVIEISLSEF